MLEKKLRCDWDNQDEASPVLHFDLTMCDIRDLLHQALEQETLAEKNTVIQYTICYVKGLTDGNRFFRKKPIIRRGC